MRSWPPEEPRFTVYDDTGKPIEQQRRAGVLATITYVFVALLLLPIIVDSEVRR